MITVPAVQFYDLARAHIARGLTAGGVRVLWNQFPTGSFVPLPYNAFRSVFADGWRKYNPFKPPVSQTLARKEAKPKLKPSLSYAYSEEHKVSHVKFFVRELMILAQDSVQRNPLLGWSTEPRKLARLRNFATGKSCPLWLWKVSRWGIGGGQVCQRRVGDVPVQSVESSTL